MMENWCNKIGFRWGQGIGVGAGEMLKVTEKTPLGYGPKKNLGKALSQCSDNISNCVSDKNMSINPNFPRVLYKILAEAGWIKLIKSNELKRNDLFLNK